MIGSKRKKAENTLAIKFGMSVADMILQLTKGFMKATGRKPEALEKIKIQQEAVQRFKDMNKVVDMEGKVIDTSKEVLWVAKK